MNIKQLHKELIAEGVPSMGASDDRIALGPPYKTATGQWVVLIGNGIEWCGTGEPTDAPGQALIDSVEAVCATHVPVVPPTPVSDSLFRRALAKAVRGKSLTGAEEDALDQAEAGLD